jgi:undecaprenyl-diphosphatase
MNAVAVVKNNDINLFYLFNRRLHCYLLDIVMRIITNLGDFPFTIALTLILLVPNKQSFRTPGLRLAVVITISQFIAQLLKRVVNRPRPYKILDHVIAVKPPACQYSFPSGHTCTAFTMAFVLANSIPGLALLVFPLACLVAVSRMYLGFHYPTDVLCGFLIAYSSFLFYVNFL